MRSKAKKDAVREARYRRMNVKRLRCVHWRWALLAAVNEIGIENLRTKLVARREMNRLYEIRADLTAATMNDVEVSS